MPNLGTWQELLFLAADDKASELGRRSETAHDDEADADSETPLLQEIVTPQLAFSRQTVYDSSM